VENKTLALYFIIAILLASNVFQFCWNNYSNRLVTDDIIIGEEAYWNDYLSFTDAVPDEETALKIGEAVAYSVYDDGPWLNRPFKVIFIESKQVWIVYGTLPVEMDGGTPEITIRKSDGKILEIYYGP